MTERDHRGDPLSDVLADALEANPMTDRLDEIRIRLGISEISSGPMTCGYQNRQAREDIAYLLKEIERLQFELQAARFHVKADTLRIIEQAQKAAEK